MIRFSGKSAAILDLERPASAADVVAVVGLSADANDARMPLLTRLTEESDSDGRRSLLLFLMLLLLLRLMLLLAVLLLPVVAVLNRSPDSVP